MHTHLTRAWVEVDLGALLRNGAAMAARGASLIPMVKADAYGLGAVAVARALEALDPFAFGVASVEEGLALRAAGISRRIIVFTPAHGGELLELRRAKMTPILSSAAEVAAWRAAGGGAWHLAVDTGMSRCGVRWNAVAALASVISAAPPEGAYTHFHSAELDDGSMEEQERRFTHALEGIAQRPRHLHAENSAALARRKRSAWPLARPGIFLYGVGTGPTALVRPESVVSLRARIVALRELDSGDTVSYGAEWRATRPSRIATVAIGYADGYRRAFSGRGAALVHGRRAPIAGVVTMDMTMLDVTDVPCAIGDVATLIGREGDGAITIEEASAMAALTPYELLTGLGARSEHSYHGIA